MALADVGGGSNEHPRKLRRDPLFTGTGQWPVVLLKVETGVSPFRPNKPIVE
jgi:hypothetical protein